MYRLIDEATERLLLETKSVYVASREAVVHASRGKTVRLRGPRGFAERRYLPDLAAERRWRYRVLCGNTVACDNPEGPWMFPDSRTVVCRHCYEAKDP